MKKIKAKNGEWVNLSNHLPTLTKVAATPEFREVAEKMAPYENKTDKKSLAAVKKLQKEYKEVIEARQAQIDEVNAILAQEIEIEVNPITTDIYPDNITAEQIMGLQILR